MNQEFEDELSTEERRALDRLVREKMPPLSLEERVVETLKRANLLRPSMSMWIMRAPRIGLVVATSLLFFVLGGLAGTKWVSGPERKSNAPQFMLVLRSAPVQSEPHTREEVMQIAREYGNWAGQLRQQGVRVDGEKLGQEARILRASDGRGVTHDNLSPTRVEKIVGYFLIEARDYEQAAKIAEGCPHLKYGGIIEVRQIGSF